MHALEWVQWMQVLEWEVSEALECMGVDADTGVDTNTEVDGVDASAEVDGVDECIQAQECMEVLE